jgi:hypothetical protein
VFVSSDYPLRKVKYPKPGWVDRGDRDPHCFGYCLVPTQFLSAPLRSLGEQQGAIQKYYDGLLKSRYKWGGFYIDRDADKEFRRRPWANVMSRRVLSGDCVLVTRLDCLCLGVDEFFTVAGIWIRQEVSLISIQDRLEILECQGVDPLIFCDALRNLYRFVSRSNRRASDILGVVNGLPCDEELEFIALVYKASCSLSHRDVAVFLRRNGAKHPRTKKYATAKGISRILESVLQYFRLREALETGQVEGVVPEVYVQAINHEAMDGQYKTYLNKKLSLDGSEETVTQSGSPEEVGQ